MGALFSAMRLRHRLGARGWHPTMSPYVLEWYDHSRGRTDDADGRTSSWRGRYGVGPAVLASTTARPIWSATAMPIGSARAGITFDGVNTKLKALSVGALPTGNRPVGILVCGYNPNNTAANVIVNYGDSPTVNNVYLGRSGTGLVRVTHDDTLEIGPVMPIGPFIIEGRFLGKSVEGTTNAAEFTRNPMAAVANLNIGTAVLAIGGSISLSLASPFQGVITDVIFYDVQMPLLDRARLQSWLAWGRFKQAASGLLPSSQRLSGAAPRAPRRPLVTPLWVAGHNNTFPSDVGVDPVDRWCAFLRSSHHRMAREYGGSLTAGFTNVARQNLDTWPTPEAFNPNPLIIQAHAFLLGGVAVPTTFTSAGTYVSATSFTLPGDVTKAWPVAPTAWTGGGWVRAKGATTGTITGWVTAATYDSGANLTTVTASWDAGLLRNEALQVSSRSAILGAGVAKLLSDEMDTALWGRERTLPGEWVEQRVVMLTNTTADVIWSGAASSSNGDHAWRYDPTENPAAANTVYAGGVLHGPTNIKDTYCPVPAFILGRFEAPIVSQVNIGDSISGGVNDSLVAIAPDGTRTVVSDGIGGGGWMRRASYMAEFPFMNISLGGTLLQYYAETHAGIQPWFQHFTDASIFAGLNDIKSSRTASQIVADSHTFCAALRAEGVQRVCISNMPPRVTELGPLNYNVTDLDHQVPGLGMGNGQVRDQLNTAWASDGTFDHLLDVASIVQDPTDHTKFKLRPWSSTLAEPSAVGDTTITVTDRPSGDPREAYIIDPGTSLCDSNAQNSSAGVNGNNIIVFAPAYAFAHSAGAVVHTSPAPDGTHWCAPVCAAVAASVQATYASFRPT